jgi:ribosomal protein L37AE/L43A
MYYDDDDRDEGYLIDGVGFADPGGRSALRAATKDNPRIYPCPTCGRENMLTRIDVMRHYQCDRCADEAEGHGGYGS